MNVLLTGATGYIGSRLLPYLVEKNHQVFCIVRDPNHMQNTIKAHRKNVHLIVCDLFEQKPELPNEIDVAYYLIHSMKESCDSFQEKEHITANHFLEALATTKVKQIIYLGGLITSHKLSPHLGSRYEVEKILASKSIPLTTFRSGIIIGSSSASFEIIRDLCEKLPLMVAPKWVDSLCQPIGIDDALYYLTAALGKKACYHRTFDIGGPSIVSYKTMLKTYAKKRGLKRCILTIPVLTPHLSSFWLYFITSINFSLAKILIESVKNNAICTEQSVSAVLPHQCISFIEALTRAMQPIAQTAFFKAVEEAKLVVQKGPHLIDFIQIPHHGCFSLSMEISPPIKSLAFYKKQHTSWDLLKDSSSHLIFYSKKRREYWVEYILNRDTITGKLWHRPKGLFQRVKWYFFSSSMKKFLAQSLNQSVENNVPNYS